jgi:3-hydroxyacyl-CoA dehydrogenase
MHYNKPIHRIAIVGTGVIGASWAAQYLARGFDVVATDPAPNAEANLRKYIDDAWKDLTTIGLSKGTSRDRLTFTTDLKDGLFDIVAAGTIARCGYQGDYIEVTRVFEMLRPFPEMSIFERLRKIA